MYYQVNPESIIFLTADHITGFMTIAYDWVSDDVFLIRPHEYGILKFIYDNQPIGDQSLMKHMADENERQTLKSMLEIFTQKKILYCHEQ